MQKRISRILHLLILIVLLATCGSTIYFIKQDPGNTPTAIPTLPRTLKFRVCSMRNAAPDTGWSALQPGLERRVIQLCDQENKYVESLHIWRLDQNYFRLDVAFKENPVSLQSWQKETNALMVVNGGYYSVANEKYSPDGLTIVNGTATGQSFAGFGGMLAVKDSGAELRWLVQKPYDPYEALHAALQSFPVLVQPGGRLGFGPERENNVGARRTVIGQDTKGRILFIIAPQGYFTLHQMSLYLTASDLNLDIAVNLDGGGSTGILVANPHELISSDRPIPFVILVYPR